MSQLIIPTTSNQQESITTPNQEKLYSSYPNQFYGFKLHKV
jgi:hypothetical protein